MQESVPSVYAPTAIEPARNLVESFLAERVASGLSFGPGETIQLSWIWLRVEESAGIPKITAPKFHAMPMEFTEDCSESLNLVARQRYICDSFGAGVEGCNCMQYAVAVRDWGSRSRWFMNRTASEDGRASGWFVGAVDSDLDLNNADNLAAVSLWELFCRKPNSGDFFLLPPGWQVVFEDRPVVLYNHQRVEPRQGSLFQLKYEP